ncbi:hypothetical protein HDK90DRAFT_261955 [Phyllosticta capitalensis]|uniref:Uncharacterized protein n=1 Tax=Phyllosticta capitalensis TaxID=121624 RepID=A0ABR1YRE8_9PEZI
MMQGNESKMSHTRGREESSKISPLQVLISNPRKCISNPETNRKTFLFRPPNGHSDQRHFPQHPYRTTLSQPPEMDASPRAQRPDLPINPFARRVHCPRNPRRPARVGAVLAQRRCARRVPAVWFAEAAAGAADGRRGVCGCVAGGGGVGGSGALGGKATRTIMGMEQEAAADWKGTQEKMKTLYREGYTAPTDPTNQVSPDRALSFFDRLCALCSLLRDWKSACDMMAGPAQDYACVALPLSYRKAFEHRAHEELQHAQQLVAHDPSMMTDLADLARKAAECGLFQVPLLPALPLPDATVTDLRKFNLDVALVDAAGLEQFLRKQASASLFTNQVVTEVEEHSPPSKRRRIGK